MGGDSPYQPADGVVAVASMDLSANSIIEWGNKSLQALQDLKLMQLEERALHEAFMEAENNSLPVSNNLHRMLLMEQQTGLADSRTHLWSRLTHDIDRQVRQETVQGLEAILARHTERRDIVSVRQAKIRKQLIKRIAAALRELGRRLGFSCNNSACHALEHASPCIPTNQLLILQDQQEAERWTLPIITGDAALDEAEYNAHLENYWEANERFNITEAFKQQIAATEQAFDMDLARLRSNHAADVAAIAASPPTLLSAVSSVSADSTAAAGAPSSPSSPAMSPAGLRRAIHEDERMNRFIAQYEHDMQMLLARREHAVAHLRREQKTMLIKLKYRELERKQVRVEKVSLAQAFTAVAHRVIAVTKACRPATVVPRDERYGGAAVVHAHVPGTSSTSSKQQSRSASHRRRVTKGSHSNPLAPLTQTVASVAPGRDEVAAGYKRMQSAPVQPRPELRSADSDALALGADWRSLSVGEPTPAADIADEPLGSASGAGAQHILGRSHLSNSQAGDPKARTSQAAAAARKPKPRRGGIRNRVISWFKSGS